MKVSLGQENALRETALKVTKFGGVIGTTINQFFKGAIGCAIVLVVVGLMVANPDTATFGDFLRNIQSPAYAFVSAIGGVMFIGARMIFPSK